MSASVKATSLPTRRCAAGDGRLVLPGRAIGGALRTLATRLAPRLALPGIETRCKALRPAPKNKSLPLRNENDGKTCGCITCQLFGDLYPAEEDARERGGAASRLWISDAYVTGPEQQAHVRDGVGLSRDAGAAARNIKFDFETAPRGTRFDLRLRLVDDDWPASELGAQLLSATLAEWESGRGRFGAGAARGLGAFKLNNIQYLKPRLDDVDDLLAYLAADEPRRAGVDDATHWAQALTAARQARRSVSGETLPVARGFIAVSFTLECDGPLLRHDSLVALLSGFDHAPQLETAVGTTGLPVLSGGSLRGALRTHAEKIARTLWSLHWPAAEFLARCPACHPLARNTRAPLASCDARLTTPTDQEAAEDDLCLGCRLFGSTRRGSRLWVDDAHWAGAQPTETTCKAQDFLAIDRFTGGGQDGAKFDAAALVGARFAARITLHSPRAWELGWLALTLRDLCDGRIRLGFGAAKGYGQARAVGLTWQLGSLADDDLPCDAALLAGGQPDGIHTVCTRAAAEMTEQLQAWASQFLAQRESYQPSAKCPPPQSDTFTQPAESLYGPARSGR
ncbi:MAG: RAMP superfamily CRISPR-associated protein [Gammaproteobacteria bacterium]